MAVDEQNLERLVEAPSERLDMELKSWLDLTDNGQRGTLAKGLIALANHGGGVIIIGFDTGGKPAPNRPADLAPYSQDAVNDVVDRFADPGFHCTVHHVTRSADGLQYPLILVPGGHIVPIRSKRGSPSHEIQADRYYIRRPGPASEMPQGGHEWNELIRRCVRNNTDDVASLIRDVLEGRAPKADAPADTAARLTQWDRDSVARWSESLEPVPAESPIRMPHGHYRISCIVDGVNLELPRLREVMQASNLHFTGWPPWWWPTRQGIAPYIHEDSIECHIAEHVVHADAAHSDFWRASRTGCLFLIRGYTEDSMETDDQRPVPAGTVFDLTLPVWRIGECLMFIQRFATEADAAESNVTVRCQWTGLQGRSLTVLSGRRFMMPDRHTTRTDGYTSTITVPVERIAASLPEIVRELIHPLYPLFDFFEPPSALYAEELGRMLRREF